MTNVDENYGGEDLIAVALEWLVVESVQADIVISVISFGDFRRLQLVFDVHVNLTLTH